MQYVLDATEMKNIEKRVIEGYGVSSIVLMEKAALSVFEAICERKIDLSHTLILCGVGNNGADGVALARIMCEHHYHPHIYICGSLEHATKEFLQQLDILKHYDATILTEYRADAYITIIDAIFGIGLSRDIVNEQYELIKTINDVKATKIAVDIASGIDAGTGQIKGIAFRADITVTFEYRKAGQILYPGRSYTGELVVKNIGIVEQAFAEMPRCYTLDQKELMIPKRTPDANKGTYGKLLIIAGSREICGAALLCAEAAFKMGTGMVKVVTHVNNREAILSKIPECMTLCYEEPLDAQLCTDFEEQLNEAVGWSEAVIIGPGLSINLFADLLCRKILTIHDKPVVIDADALNVIAEKSLYKELSSNMILTPHMGEMSRLSGDSIMWLKQNSLTACRAYAEARDVTCVMKDAATVVATRGCMTYINTSGNSGMATAGSGDLLAGIIGALCAQGYSMNDAAVHGVFLHGIAGDLAKEKHGEASMMPSDMIKELKEILKREM